MSHTQCLTHSKISLLITRLLNYYVNEKPRNFDFLSDRYAPYHPSASVNQQNLHMSYNSGVFVMDLCRVAKQRLLFWLARSSHRNYYQLWQWKLIFQALKAWTLCQPNQWHITAKPRDILESLEVPVCGAVVDCFSYCKTSSKQTSEPSGWVPHQGLV